LQNDILSFTTGSNKRVRAQFSKMHYSIQ
jgi:hypothetical protein